MSGFNEELVMDIIGKYEALRSRALRIANEVERRVYRRVRSFGVASFRIGETSVHVEAGPGGGLDFPTKYLWAGLPDSDDALRDDLYGRASRMLKDLKDGS